MGARLTILLTVIAMTGCTTHMTPPAGPAYEPRGGWIITADRALTLHAAGATFLDTRAATAYKAGHVAGAHNVAWQEYLARAAEDPAEFISPQPAVNDTFFEARTPLWQAVPGIDFLDLERRLRVIYADSESGEGTAA